VATFHLRLLDGVAARGTRPPLGPSNTILCCVRVLLRCQLPNHCSSNKRAVGSVVACQGSNFECDNHYH
jgi:hypothetical protein